MGKESNPHESQSCDSSIRETEQQEAERPESGGQDEAMHHHEIQLHWALHDFRVAVETQGLEKVFNAMDDETYWKIATYFKFKS